MPAPHDATANPPTPFFKGGATKQAALCIEAYFLMEPLGILHSQHSQVIVYKAIAVLNCRICGFIVKFSRS